MLDKAVAMLRGGKVVAAATETFFGLLADIEEPRALDAVFRFKGRGAERASALLLPSFEAWSELVVTIPPQAERLAEAFWPGPLTIVLPARAGLDPRLVVDGRVGVRLPASSPAADLVRAYGKPLTATSANRTGEPPLSAAQEVERIFAAEVNAGELLVFPGEAPGGAPSTVVALEEGELRVLREGAISKASLQAALKPPPADTSPR